MCNDKQEACKQCYGLQRPFKGHGDLLMYRSKGLLFAGASYKWCWVLCSGVTCKHTGIILSTA